MGICRSTATGLLSLATVLLALSPWAESQTQPVPKLQVKPYQGCAWLTWNVPGDATIYRCTQSFDPREVEDPLLPICKLPKVYEGRSALDRHVAPGVPYYFQVKIGQRWLSAGPFRLPARKLAPSQNPWILVDKRHYALEVRTTTKLLKRYAFVMGGKPTNRKLVQDRASTPEGRYKIIGVQPKVQYHKAYDIN